LITSTPRSAAWTACATIVISGTEIRCCPIRPHWIPQPRVRADVHVPMGARMIGTGSCSCCDRIPPERVSWAFEFSLHLRAGGGGPGSPIQIGLLDRDRVRPAHI
jgi:hypothetical protein